jgi:hypothetical protein
MRRLTSSLLAVVLVGALHVPARATKITVLQYQIPGWTATGVGQTADLWVTALQPFTENVNLVTLQPPGRPNAWRRVLPCVVTSAVDPTSGETIKTLTIPPFVIDSTVDGIDVKNARYRAEFRDKRGTLIEVFQGFEQFRVNNTWANSPVTNAKWSDIRTFNYGPSMPDHNTDYYTRAETLRLINQVIASGVGLTSLGGQSAATYPVQTFANGTNVTINSALGVHTIGISGVIAVANGGTGGGTASAARTSLGAAASGANGDITSLAGLTTPLSAPQGGTSFGSYTKGDILVATGAGTLAKLAVGTDGKTLTTNSATATGLEWSMATGTLGGGGANGRVAFWNGAVSLSSNANFAWDDATSRLSLGAPPSSLYRLNLAAGDYVSGYGANLYAGYHLAPISAAQRRMIGVGTDTYVASATGAGTGILYTTTNTDVVNLSPDQPVVMRYTQSGATGYTGLAPVGIVATNGFDFKLGMFGAYNTSAANSSNVFQFTSDVKSYNTAPVVAIFGGGNAMASGAQAWGANLSAFAAASSAVGIADETDFGMIGDNLTSPQAYGKVIVAVGHSGVPLTAGAGKDTDDAGATYYYDGGAYLQLQSNTAVFKPDVAIAFNYSGNQIVNAKGSLINAVVGLTAQEGINFAGLNTSNAAILIRNDDYIKSNNAGNTASLRLIHLNTSDDVVVGDSGALGNTETVVDGANTPEILRALSTRRLGINTRSTGAYSVTPTHTLQTRSTMTRTITGTVATNSGSATVTGTGTAFLTDVRAGSSFVVNGDATLYHVLNVASDTSLTLTANAAATLTNRAVTTDDAMLLVEAEDGTDHVEIDNQGRLKVTGGGPHPVGATAANQDLLGAIRIVGRANPNRRLLFDVDETDGNAYINSLVAGSGWGNIVMQAGGGFVGIGTAFPSATLTVGGFGSKTSTFILSNFESLATNTSGTPHEQFGTIYSIYPLTTWLGPLYGVRYGVRAAFDASGNRTGYPATFHGGRVLIAPDATASPIYQPASMLQVYAQPVLALAGTGTDGQTVSVTNASTTVTAAGGASFASMQVGEALQFGTDTATYQIASVDSASQVTLTTTYAGPTATLSQAWGDPPLLTLMNGFGATALEVRGGRTTVGNTLVEKVGTAIASAGTIDLTNTLGNVFHVTGTTSITTVNGGVAGMTVTFIFDGILTFTDGSNLKLAGNFVTTADDTITITYDGSNWYERGRSVN